jgi:hypothetical protein
MSPTRGRFRPPVAGHRWIRVRAPGAATEPRDCPPPKPQRNQLRIQRTGHRELVRERQRRPIPTTSRATQANEGRPPVAWIRRAVGGLCRRPRDPRVFVADPSTLRPSKTDTDTGPIQRRHDQTRRHPTAGLRSQLIYLQLVKGENRTSTRPGGTRGALRREGLQQPEIGSSVSREEEVSNGVVRRVDDQLPRPWRTLERARNHLAGDPAGQLLDSFKDQKLGDAIPQDKPMPWIEVQRDFPDLLPVNPFTGDQVPSGGGNNKPPMWKKLAAAGAAAAITGSVLLGDNQK